MRFITESRITNCCPDGTALVAGNGPSLKYYDKELYEMFPFSVGVNTIAKVFRPTIIYNIEVPPFQWTEPKDPDVLGIPWITDIKNVASLNADWFVKLHYDMNMRGMFPLNKDCYDGFSATSHMSPFGAMHVAYLTGVKRIYLIGIDFCRGPEEELYHEGRSHNGKEKWYVMPDDPKYIQNLSWFSLAFAALKQVGVEVYDLSPFGKLRDIKKVKDTEIIWNGTKVNPKILLDDQKENFMRPSDFGLFNPKDESCEGTEENETQHVNDHANEIAKVDSNDNDTVIVIGTGPGASIIDKNELRKHGKIMTINGGICSITKPDFAVISSKNILEKDHGLANKLEIYGMSGGRVYVPNNVETKQFKNYKKYESFCMFNFTASIKATSCDPIRGFHTKSGGAILAMQMAKWLGFKNVILIGFDFKLFPNGRLSIIDKKPIAKDNREGIEQMLEDKKKTLEQYLKFTDMHVMAPDWSPIEGAKTVRVPRIKMRKEEEERFIAAMNVQSAGEIQELRDAIIGKLRIGLCPPARSCAVQDQFDGVKVALENLGCMIFVANDQMGLRGKIGDVNDLDAVIFCPQIQEQMQQTNRPDRKTFLSYRKKRTMTILMLPDEPYETGWYDDVARQCDLVLTNEKNCVKRMQNAMYYPLTANSKVHRKIEVGDEYKSDVLFAGGFDDRAFSTRLKFFQNARETLDKPENLFIGGNVKGLGYKHARVIAGRVDNEELVKFYNGAKININIHRDDCRAGQDNIFNREQIEATHINPRTFEIVGCRAFQICDDSRSELRQFFPKMPTFNSAETMSMLVDEYLKNQEMRDQSIQMQIPVYHDNLIGKVIANVRRWKTDRMNMKNNSDIRRIVVYSAIFGGKDDLSPIAVKEYGVDYICYTDNPNLHADGWTMRVVPIIDGDPVRTARMYKILAHRHLPEYDLSMWLDGRLATTKRLKDWMLSRIDKEKMAVLMHPDRQCSYKEGDVCFRHQKDDPETIRKQMEHYREEGFPEDYGLLESRLLIRDHNDEQVIETMEIWWNQLQLWSNRDQLSFYYSCWKTGLKPLQMGYKKFREVTRAKAHVRRTNPMTGRGVMA